MGRDELRPLTRRGEDMWGGVGFTLIDCLDVLLMMDLDVEYARCSVLSLLHMWFTDSMSRVICSNPRLHSTGAVMIITVVDKFLV